MGGVTNSGGCLIDEVEFTVACWREATVDIRLQEQRASSL
jgi:hypothetical protein